MLKNLLMNVWLVESTDPEDKQEGLPQYFFQWGHGTRVHSSKNEINLERASYYKYSADNYVYSHLSFFDGLVDVSLNLKLIAEVEPFTYTNKSIDYSLTLKAALKMYADNLTAKNVEKLEKQKVEMVRSEKTSLEEKVVADTKQLSNAYGMGIKIQKSSVELPNREKTHGGIVNQGDIEDQLREVLTSIPSFKTLPGFMKSNLLACILKISRILAGDEYFLDHWVDLAGYPNKVAEYLMKELTNDKKG